MEKELVSVITPTYNRGEILKETIKSVLNQTYQNFEYLIIDDGSTDNIREIVQSFQDKRIKYIPQQHCGRPAPGRNKGLKIAKGEYIAFLDSDDLWLPNKLEKQINQFKKNEDILLIGTNAIIIPMRPYKIYLSIRENKRINYKELMLGNNPVMTSSVLMKRSVADVIGLMDEELLLRAVEDYDYWLRLLKYRNKSIMILKDILVKYRAHESNITKEKDPTFFRQMYKKLAFIYKKHPNFNPSLIENKLRETLYHLKVAIKIESLSKGKNNIFNVLRDRNLRFYDRLWIIIGNFSDKYLKAVIKNYIIDKLNNYLIYFKHKLLT